MTVSASNLITLITDDVRENRALSETTLSKLLTALPRLSQRETYQLIFHLQELIRYQCSVKHGKRQISDEELWSSYITTLKGVGKDLLLATTGSLKETPLRPPVSKKTQAPPEVVRAFKNVLGGDPHFVKVMRLLTAELLTEEEESYLQQIAQPYLPQKIDHVSVKLSISEGLALCRDVHKMLLVIMTHLPETAATYVYFPEIMAYEHDKKQFSEAEKIQHLSKYLEENDADIFARADLVELLASLDRPDQIRKHLKYFLSKIGGWSLEEVDRISHLFFDGLADEYPPLKRALLETEITDDLVEVNFLDRFLGRLHSLGHKSHAISLLAQWYSRHEGGHVQYDFLLGWTLVHQYGDYLDAVAIGLTLVDLLNNYQEELSKQPWLKKLLLKEVCAFSIIDVLARHSILSTQDISEECARWFHELCDLLVQEGEEERFITFAQRIEEIDDAGVVLPPLLKLTVTQLKQKAANSRIKEILPSIPGLKELLLANDLDGLQKASDGIESDSKLSISGAELKGLINRIRTASELHHQMEEIKRQNDILLHNQVSKFIYDAIKFRQITSEMKNLEARFDTNCEVIVDEIHRRTVENFRFYHLPPSYEEFYCSMLGNEMWALLHEMTRTFLNIAQHLYEKNKHSPISDFGFIAIEYSKALEHEFQTKVIEKFFGSSEMVYQVEKRKLTLGNIPYILGDIAKGESSGNKEFNQFCLRKKWDKSHLKMVEKGLHKIVQEFRNPAAHPREYPLEKLEKFRRMLLEDRFFKTFLEMWM